MSSLSMLFNRKAWSQFSSTPGFDPVFQVGEVVNKAQSVEGTRFQKDLRPVGVAVWIGALTVVVQEAVPTVKGELNSYLVHRGNWG